MDVVVLIAVLVAFSTRSKKDETELTEVAQTVCHRPCCCEKILLLLYSARYVGKQQLNVANSAERPQSHLNDIRKTVVVI